MSRRIFWLAAPTLLLAGFSALAQEAPKAPDSTVEPAIPATAAPEIAPKPEPLPAAASTPPPAKPEGFLTADQEQANKLGFYFAMSLDKMSQLGQANGIGFVVDPQVLPGNPYAVSGPEVDGDFRSRWALGFKLGFRLRGNHGRVEASYFQWQEQQDLNTRPPDGKALASALTSPRAGYFEDVGRPLVAGGPDGTINGFEAGSIPEGSEAPDRVLDGAEDVNFNGLPDFIRMGTINRIAGEMKTNLKVLDLDYVHAIKTLKRLTLDGRAGLRFASVTQLTDIGYQDIGAFAVYSDDEGAPAG